jgi:hypothetical protein
MPLTIYRPARLQDQLATLQASFEASTAAAKAELEQKTSELDSMKNKLLTERTANRRQMEMSAEVCLQRHTVWHLFNNYPACMLARIQCAVQL